MERGLRPGLHGWRLPTEQKIFIRARLFQHGGERLREHHGIDQEYCLPAQALANIDPLRVQGLDNAMMLGLIITHTTEDRIVAELGLR